MNVSIGGNCTIFIWGIPTAAIEPIPPNIKIFMMAIK